MPVEQVGRHIPVTRTLLVSTRAGAAPAGVGARTSSSPFPCSASPPTAAPHSGHLPRAETTPPAVETALLHNDARVHPHSWLGRRGGGAAAGEGWPATPTRTAAHRAEIGELVLVAVLFAAELEEVLLYYVAMPDLKRVQVYEACHRRPTPLAARSVHGGRMRGAEGRRIGGGHLSARRR